MYLYPYFTFCIKYHYNSKCSGINKWQRSNWLKGQICVLFYFRTEHQTEFIKRNMPHLTAIFISFTEWQIAV